MLTRLETALCPGMDAFNAGLQYETESRAEKTIPVRRKLRILALHGFGQSGEYLRIAMKTGQLGQDIMAYIDADLLDQYDGVDWLCPDAPLRLVPDTRYDDGSLDDVDIFAWWRVLDFEIQHEHLYKSLRYLSDYLQEHGPVDGIVGFSQGAAVAMMLTAICENTPGRQAALAVQGAPFLSPAPQPPFKFAIACCGFQNALRYYDGFYSPQIKTPSLHIVAEFDTMVSAEQSISLAEACTDADIVHFRGTHHVPTDRVTLHNMASFIADACSRKTIVPPLNLLFALPMKDAEKRLVTISEIELDGTRTPSSPLSPCSSLSGASSRSQGSPLRMIRRKTVFRRFSNGRARTSA